MNKFAAFAVLAVAALAVASASPPGRWNPPGVNQDAGDEEMTQAYLLTTDDEETASLGPKNLEAFSDFCISSRDYVVADVKRQSSELSSQMYGLIFGSAAAIARESLDVQSQATEKLAAQLANPSAAIDADGVDQTIVNGQSQIQNQGAAQGLLTAFKTAVSAVSSKAGSLVGERLTYLKSLATPGQLVAALNKGCAQIANYETELLQQFEAYKQSSLGADAEKYAALTLDSVPCATSSKIIRGEGLCNLVSKIVDPVKKILATRA